MALTRIETDLIADSSITADKIANSAVTQSKIDPNVELGGAAVTTSATAPTSPTPSTGDLWYNTTNGKLSVYYNSGWVVTQLDQQGIGSRVVDVFTATASQTVFTTSAGYSVGYVDVYVNGIKLLPADFTATNATTVTLGSGADLNDEVVIISWTLAPGVVSFVSDIFTGNGTQTVYTLSITPSNENQTTVVIDGVSQIRNTYSVSGAALTFSEAPGNGAVIEVTTAKGSAFLTTSYNDLTDKPDLTGLGIKISNIQVTDSGGTVLDDTAVDIAGGYIKLTGSGFLTGCQVLINNVPATSTTFVSSTVVRAQVPATAAGTYIVYLVNPDGGVGIRVNGVTFSATPSWVTGSTLDNGNIDTALSIQLSATGASTFALQSGSTLPTGLTLSSGGLISGTVTGLTQETVYSFTVIASDAENQDSPRTFSITITVGDQYFNRTTLAINADVNTFVRDASTNNFPVTITGDTKPFSFSPYNTNWSIYIDGSDDLNAQSNAAFTYGTADFTIEGWFYVTGRTGPSTYEYFFAQGATTGASALGLYRQDNVLKVWQGGPSATITGTTAFSTLYNTWVHIALTRSGTTMRLFLNGALEGSATNSGNITTGTTTGISIGRWTEIGDGGYIIGYVSNFRVVKGTAVYTSAFTPSTTPLTAITNTSLLTCQDNRFIDKSTNNFTLTKNGDTAIKAFGPFTETDTTTGSGYFDGTGDYLTLAGSSAFVFGTGDFTIETWVYIPVNQAQYSSILGNSSNPDGWFLSFSTSNIVNFSNYNVTALASSSGVPLNTWTHIAVARSGTSLKMFFNGVQVASATNSTSYGVSATTYIGFNGTSYYINGYVSDVRIIKGTAVYTANFTPPTSPLTAITNTQVLTLQNRQPVNNHSFIDDSGLKNTVTKVGNASQGSFSPFSPAGWSNYFDGSGDYLNVSYLTSDFGTGDFTLELFVYLTKYDGDGNTIIDTRASATANPFAFGVLSNGLAYYYNGTSYSSSTVVPLNNWVHLAICRSGTTLKIFQNGVETLSRTDSSNLTGTSTNSITIGRAVQGIAHINGYLSNLRIVKGTAVYTSNFTPPTSALTAITNTSLLTCQSNRFIDNSTNNFAITRNGDTRVVNFSPFAPTATYSPVTHAGSAYFDGSDYLQTNSTDSGLIRTGPFTLEVWIYPLSLNTTILSRFYWQTGDNGGWILSTNSSGFIVFGYSNGSWNTYGGITTTSNPIKINEWNHIAITRDSSNTLRVFVNGLSSVTPITLAQSLDTVVVQNASLQPRTFRVAVGGLGDGALSGYYTGYISSINIQPNTAKYTTNFTPSLQSVSTSSGATFLTNMNYAGITDASTRNLFESFGDAKIVTSTRKYGTGSMYFDGTGDYLASYSELTKLNCTFRTGDFTIEAWVNFATVGTDLGIADVATSTTSASSSQWYLYRISTNLIGFGNHGAGAIISSTTTTLASTWYHVAVTRSGTSLRLFVNGVLQSTVTNSTDYIAASLHLGLIGTPYLMNGYIDDFRITKGYARYTANFTPPTGTFLVR